VRGLWEKKRGMKGSENGTQVDHFNSRDPPGKPTKAKGPRERKAKGKEVQGALVTSRYAPWITLLMPRTGLEVAGPKEEKKVRKRKNLQGEMVGNPLKRGAVAKNSVN